MESARGPIARRSRNALGNWRHYMRHAVEKQRVTAILMVLVGLAAGALAIASLAYDAHAQGASAKLSDLRVRPEGTTHGYSRDAYKHWSDAREYGWRIPAGTPASRARPP